MRASAFVSTGWSGSPSRSGSVLRSRIFAARHDLLREAVPSHSSFSRRVRRTASVSRIVAPLARRCNSTDATRSNRPFDDDDLILEKYTEPGPAKTILRNQFGSATLVYIYTMFDAKMKDHMPTPAEQKLILELLKHSETTPRQALTNMGVCVRVMTVEQLKRTPFKNCVHLLPAIYRMAWNDGRDGGDPNAAVLLLRTKDHEVDPPPHIVSKIEAEAIVQSIKSSNQPEKYVHLAQAELVKWDWDEKGPWPKGLVDCLQKAWDCSDDAWSACELGNRYAYGDYLPADPAKAELWLTRAAEAGAYRAAFTLASIFGRRPRKGRDKMRLPVDHAKARKWFEVAAVRVPYAAYRLALYYYLNRRSPWKTFEEHTSYWGVEPNDTRAAELLMDALERGYLAANFELSDLRSSARLPAPIEALLVKRERLKKVDRTSVDAVRPRIELTQVSSRDAEEDAFRMMSIPTKKKMDSTSGDIVHSRNRITQVSSEADIFQMPSIATKKRKQKMVHRTAVHAAPSHIAPSQMSAEDTKARIFQMPSIPTNQP